MQKYEFESAEKFPSKGFISSFDLKRFYSRNTEATTTLPECFHETRRALDTFSEDFQQILLEVIELEHREVWISFSDISQSIVSTWLEKKDNFTLAKSPTTTAVSFETKMTETPLQFLTGSEFATHEKLSNDGACYFRPRSLLTVGTETNFQVWKKFSLWKVVD